jgi:hypothetical protein
MKRIKCGAQKLYSGEDGTGYVEIILIGEILISMGRLSNGELVSD